MEGDGRAFPWGALPPCTPRGSPGGPRADFPNEGRRQPNAFLRQKEALPSVSQSSPRCAHVMSGLDGAPFSPSVSDSPPTAPHPSAPSSPSLKLAGCAAAFATHTPQTVLLIPPPPPSSGVSSWRFSRSLSSRARRSPQSHSPCPGVSPRRRDGMSRAASPCSAEAPSKTRPEASRAAWSLLTCCGSSVVLTPLPEESRPRWPHSGVPRGDERVADSGCGESEDPRQAFCALPSASLPFTARRECDASTPARGATRPLVYSVHTAGVTTLSFSASLGVVCSTQRPAPHTSHFASIWCPYTLQERARLPLDFAARAEVVSTAFMTARLGLLLLIRDSKHSIVGYMNLRRTLHSGTPPFASRAGPGLSPPWSLDRVSVAGRGPRALLSPDFVVDCGRQPVLGLAVEPAVTTASYPSLSRALSSRFLSSSSATRFATFGQGHLRLWTLMPRRSEASLNSTRARRDERGGYGSRREDATEDEMAPPSFRSCCFGPAFLSHDVRSASSRGVCTRGGSRGSLASGAFFSSASSRPRARCASGRFGESVRATTSARPPASGSIRGSLQPPFRFPGLPAAALRQPSAAPPLVTAAAFLPESRELLAGTAEGVVFIFRGLTAVRAVAVSSLSPAPLPCICLLVPFHKTLLFVATRDGTLTLLRTTGASQRLKPCSPNAQRLSAGGAKSQTAAKATEAKVRPARDATDASSGCLTPRKSLAPASRAGGGRLTRGPRFPARFYRGDSSGDEAEGTPTDGDLGRTAWGFEKSEEKHLADETRTPPTQPSSRASLYSTRCPSACFATPRRGAVSPAARPGDFQRMRKTPAAVCRQQKALSRPAPAPFADRVFDRPVRTPRSSYAAAFGRPRALAAGAATPRAASSRPARRNLSRHAVRKRATEHQPGLEEPRMEARGAWKREFSASPCRSLTINRKHSPSPRDKESRSVCLLGFEGDLWPAAASTFSGRSPLAIDSGVDSSLRGLSPRLRISPEPTTLNFHGAASTSPRAPPRELQEPRAAPAAQSNSERRSLHVREILCFHSRRASPSLLPHVPARQSSLPLSSEASPVPAWVSAAGASAGGLSLPSLSDSFSSPGDCHYPGATTATTAPATPCASRALPAAFSQPSRISPWIPAQFAALVGWAVLPAAGAARPSSAPTVVLVTQSHILSLAVAPFCVSSSRLLAQKPWGTADAAASLAVPAAPPLALYVHSDEAAGEGDEALRQGAEDRDERGAHRLRRRDAARGGRQIGDEGAEGRRGDTRGLQAAEAPQRERSEIRETRKPSATDMRQIKEMKEEIAARCGSFFVVGGKCAVGGVAQCWTVDADSDSLRPTGLPIFFESGVSAVALSTPQRLPGASPPSPSGLLRCASLPSVGAWLAVGCDDGTVWLFLVALSSSPQPGHTPRASPSSTSLAGSAPLSVRVCLASAPYCRPQKAAARVAALAFGGRASAPSWLAVAYHGAGVQCLAVGEVSPSDRASPAVAPVCPSFLFSRDWRIASPPCGCGVLGCGETDRAEVGDAERGDASATQERARSGFQKNGGGAVAGSARRYSSPRVFTLFSDGEEGFPANCELLYVWPTGAGDECQERPAALSRRPLSCRGGGVRTPRTWQDGLESPALKRNSESAFSQIGSGALRRRLACVFGPSLTFPIFLFPQLYLSPPSAAPVCVLRFAGLAKRSVAPEESSCYRFASVSTASWSSLLFSSSTPGARGVASRCTTASSAGARTPEVAREYEELLLCQATDGTLAAFYVPSGRRPADESLSQVSPFTRFFPWMSPLALRAPGALRGRTHGGRTALEAAAAKTLLPGPYHQGVSPASAFLVAFYHPAEHTLACVTLPAPWRRLPLESSLAASSFCSNSEKQNLRRGQGESRSPSRTGRQNPLHERPAGVAPIRRDSAQRPAGRGRLPFFPWSSETDEREEAAVGQRHCAPSARSCIQPLPEAAPFLRGAGLAGLFKRSPSQSRRIGSCGERDECGSRDTRGDPADARNVVLNWEGFRGQPKSADGEAHSPHDGKTRDETQLAATLRSALHSARVAPQRIVYDAPPTALLWLCSCPGASSFLRGRQSSSHATEEPQSFPAVNREYLVSVSGRDGGLLLWEVAECLRLNTQDPQLPSCETVEGSTEAARPMQQLPKGPAVHYWSSGAGDGRWTLESDSAVTPNERASSRSLTTRKPSNHAEGEIWFPQQCAQNRVHGKEGFCQDDIRASSEVSGSQHLRGWSGPRGTQHRSTPNGNDVQWRRDRASREEGAREPSGLPRAAHSSRHLIRDGMLGLQLHGRADYSQ
ncbi:hypothetical protein BESB_039350 [Besnoitia besnoiti]|uniref:Uncharacterized protein n=1 Tax=Besnoitia besnoiti TaxID=94643 RepID=A0A2A9MNK5_BESBE|nr:hypothetical protein BESB_039350 [Besnoitia besnoiti]PFH37477.1 hypothetical protein BESB_039350 [Besnoitia besnoiti]